MQTTTTYFEQVPLETIQAIIRAEKLRRIEPEITPPSGDKDEPKSRTPRRD